MSARGRATLGTRGATLTRVLAAAALGVLIGCGRSGPEVSVQNLRDGLGQLRAGFNADASKLRLVLLLDPT